MIAISISPSFRPVFQSLNIVCGSFILEEISHIIQKHWSSRYNGLHERKKHNGHLECDKANTPPLNPQEKKIPHLELSLLPGNPQQATHDTFYALKQDKTTLITI